MDILDEDLPTDVHLGELFSGEDTIDYTEYI